MPLAGVATLLCPSVMLTRTLIESFFWAEGRNINKQAVSLILNVFVAALLVSSGANGKINSIKTFPLVYSLHQNLLLVDNRIIYMFVRGSQA